MWQEYIKSLGCSDMACGVDWDYRPAEWELWVDMDANVAIFTPVTAKGVLEEPVVLSVAYNRDCMIQSWFISFDGWEDSTGIWEE